MGVEAIYPGERSTPADIVRLADEYRAAAVTLRAQGRPREPASWAPFRLAALHALELYLNALLRADGATPAAVRTLQHDLLRRAQSEAVSRLKLRRRTAEHLRELTARRDYLLARYEPEAVEPCTRMEATLAEVAAKVRARLAASVG